MNASPLNRLIKLLARLPGVGEKSATRLAHFLWQAPPGYAEELAQAILTVREKIKPCPQCGAPTQNSPCEICADPSRQRHLLMVVENAQDLAAMEKSGAFRGLYHVLGGTISPLAGRGPEQLRLPQLLARLQNEPFQEVILATNPSAEGDATAAFLEQTLQSALPHLQISRLARGLPAGAELRYLDPLSLTHALQDRKSQKKV